MPPKGWKKGRDGTHHKITGALIEKSGVGKAPPEREAVFVQDVQLVQPLPRPDRLKELLRGIPDDQFMLMVSNSGMDRDRVRELCDLFRKLKA